jgi:hypothetical protein
MEQLSPAKKESSSSSFQSFINLDSVSESFPNYYPNSWQSLLDKYKPNPKQKVNRNSKFKSAAVLVRFEANYQVNRCSPEYEEEKQELKKKIIRRTKSLSSVWKNSWDIQPFTWPKKTSKNEFFGLRK